MRGQVVESDGRPAQRAHVRMSALSEDRSEADPVGFTDDAGFFAIDVPSVGVYTMVAVDRKLQAAAIIPWLRIGEARPQHVLLRLRESREISGVVLDEDALPVLGATVSVDLLEPVGEALRLIGCESKPRAERLSTVTESDGSFRLAPLFPGQCGVSAHKDGYLSAPPSPIEAGTLGVRLSLRRGARLVGHVEGGPPNGPVDIRVDSGKVRTRVVTQGGAADFELVVPLRSRSLVVAEAPGYDRASGWVGPDFARQAPALILTMHLGREIAGRVLRTDSRESVPGATVRLYRVEFGSPAYRVSPEAISVAADSMGAWTATVASGFWAVIGVADGFVDPQFDSPVGRLIDARRPVGSVTVELRPTGSIRGDVVYANGTECAGATVSVGEMVNQTPGEPFSVPPIPSVSTDSAGAFRITGLPAGVAYRLECHGPEGFEGSSELIVVEVQSSVTIRLKLDGSASDLGVVRGRVVDDSGAPASGALVAVGRWLLTADGDGAFERSVPVGEIQVEAVAPGYLPARSSPFDVVRSRTVDIGALALRPGLTLSGRVVDERGEALADVLVAGWFPIVIGQYPRVLSVLTAPDGLWRLTAPSPLPTGSWVQASRPGIAGARISLETVPDLAAMTIRAVRAASVVGDVTFPGLAPRFLDLRIRRAASAEWRSVKTSWIMEGERFEATEISAGDWQFCVVAAGHAPVLFAARQVGPGETVDLGPIHFSVGVSVAGKLLDADSNGVEGGTIEIEGLPLRVRTDPDGGFVLDSVPPGEWALRATHDHDSGVARKTIWVGSDPPSPVVIQWRR